MIYATLTGVVFILGFAYVIWVLANKESANMKLAGQIIAVLVALVAVVVLFCGITGRGHCGMMGGKGMMGGSYMKGPMMMEMMKKDPSIMQDMCKNPEMRKMMQKSLKKYGK